MPSWDRRRSLEVDEELDGPAVDEPIGERIKLDETPVPEDDSETPEPVEGAAAAEDVKKVASKEIAAIRGLFFALLWSPRGNFLSLGGTALVLLPIKNINLW